MSTLEIEFEDLRPASVAFTDTDLVVFLGDGRKIVTPLDWYPRLKKATLIQRQNYALGAVGIYWPDVDEDLSVPGMLRGRVAANDLINQLLRGLTRDSTTPADYEAQKRSFAFGNTSLDNDAITEAMFATHMGRAIGI